LADCFDRIAELLEFAFCGFFHDSWFGRCCAQTEFVAWFGRIALNFEPVSAQISTST